MNIDYLIIHDSDSKYGDAFIVNEWHEKKGYGWLNPKTGITYHIGYHYLIYNGHVFNNNHYEERADGILIPGRPHDIQGSHCLAKSMNRKSLGICFIGPPFTENQMQVGTMLVRELMDLYDVPLKNVLGHKEVDPNKKDPRFDMQTFRDSLT